MSIGLVGSGPWAMRLLGQLASMGVEVVCYPGRSVASRKRFSSMSGYQTVGHLDELLSAPTIDAIAIATPPETHATLAQSSLDAGKPTFVEKPLCLAMADLQRMVHAAEKNSRVLFTGYTVAYHPVIREVHRLVAEGSLRSTWSYKAKTGTFESDIVSTLLVHDLAVVDGLTGGFRDWSIHEMSGSSHDPDAVSLTYRSPSGARGVIRVDRVSPSPRREMGIWVDDRVLRWDGGSELLELVDGDFSTIFSSQASALEIELRQFLDAVAAGRPDPGALQREARIAEVAIRVRDEILA